MKKVSEIWNEEVRYKISLSKLCKRIIVEEELWESIGNIVKK
jgi:hypothetical protein